MNRRWLLQLLDHGAFPAIVLALSVSHIKVEGSQRRTASGRPVGDNLGVSLKERGRFEEAERAFQEAIRLNPQDALGSNSVADLLQEPWGLEKLSSLNEKAVTSLRTPIGWRDIFN